MNSKKQAWEMSYEELFQEWSSKHDFGAKGAMTPEEARQVHLKWKRLGTEAKLGIL